MTKKEAQDYVVKFVRNVYDSTGDNYTAVARIITEEANSMSTGDYSFFVDQVKQIKAFCDELIKNLEE